MRMNKESAEMQKQLLMEFGEGKKITAKKMIAALALGILVSQNNNLL